MGFQGRQKAVRLSGEERLECFPDPFPGKKNRILIADESVLVRRGLVRLLAGEPDLECCGECHHAQDLFHHINKLQPDLLLLDLGLRDGDAAPVVSSLRARFPSLKILVFSPYTNRQSAQAAVEAGACGYISKQAAVETILSAIRLIVSGKLHVALNAPLCTQTLDFRTIQRLEEHSER